jgi:hypothetical protein
VASVPGCSAPSTRSTMGTSAANWLRAPAASPPPRSTGPAWHGRSGCRGTPHQGPAPRWAPARPTGREPQPHPPHTRSSRRGRCGPNTARTRRAAAVSRHRRPASRSQRSAREGGRQVLSSHVIAIAGFVAFAVAGTVLNLLAHRPRLRDTDDGRAVHLDYAHPVPAGLRSWPGGHASACTCSPSETRFAVLSLVSRGGGQWKE